MQENQAPRSQGFTLVELLAVLATIVVLAAIMIPTLGRARRSALRGRTQTDVGTLCRAFQMYYIEYDEWPDGLVGPDTGTNVETDDATASGIEMVSNVVCMLRGEDINDRNPGKSQFVDIPHGRLRADGAFCDPWGNPYKYMCDFNYDGTVHLLYGDLAGNDYLDEKGIVVWSRGPDGSDAQGRQDDDITSWKLPKK